MKRKFFLLSVPIPSCFIFWPGFQYCLQKTSAFCSLPPLTGALVGRGWEQEEGCCSWRGLALSPQSVPSRPRLRGGVCVAALASEHLGAGSTSPWAIQVGWACWGCSQIHLPPVWPPPRILDPNYWRRGGHLGSFDKLFHQQAGYLQLSSTQDLLYCSVPQGGCWGRLSVRGGGPRALGECLCEHMCVTQHAICAYGRSFSKV